MFLFYVPVTGEVFLCQQYKLISLLQGVGTTVNVDIFAQYIFSRISRRALDARKFDQNRTNRNK